LGAEVTLFVLLHGGMHHGSSWELVVPRLVERGHRVIAPDLPMDDDKAGAREWARVAIDAIQHAGDDDVIMVGHSIAGLCVPVVATLHPVRRMVFIGGLLPVPGQRFVDHLAENPDAISFPAGEASGSGPFGLTWESVQNGFYHDCPESIARQAFDQLRGQSFTAFIEECPIERWPNVPSTYMLMRHDRAVGQSWARRNAADRVGATIIEMDGGHSPFFARPNELSDVLADIACDDRVV
jgi:pimeloyl-ACP methyl ester carboxylesterase